MGATSLVYMTFALTEFFPGFGSLCASLSEGLARFGDVRVAGAVELDGRYLRLFSKQHPESSTFLGSVTGYAPAETSLPQPEATTIFVAGVPCQGASKSGAAKNHLSAAEMHADVGHLFLPTLHHISQKRPMLCVLENVPAYKHTVSAAIIRTFLAKLGYSVTEHVVNPFADFATATERVRWILVASRIGPFAWNYTPQPFTGTIAHLLDPVSPADLSDEFSPEQVAAHTKYCARKAAEGCGFSRRILTRDSVKVPTIPKSAGKIQPTGVFVASGTSANSYRMLRPREIARIHGFGPEFINIIEQLPKTTAYEVLGQGVVAAPFRALGGALAAFVAATRLQRAA